MEYLAQVNGDGSCLDKASENCRKRQRPAEEDGPEENGVSVEWKKKKRKKGSEGSLERDAKQASGGEKNKKSQGKCTEKKKRKKAEEKSSTVTPKPAASTKNTPVRVDQTVKSNKKSPVAQNVSSSDSSSSSSSSEEDKAPKKVAAQKPASKTPSSTPASSKAHPTNKPTKTKPHPPSSSSSETVSSSDEATSVKPPPKSKPSTSTTPKGRISDDSKPQQTPPALRSTNCAQKQPASVAAPPHGQVAKPCTSSSEEEIEFVIRRPVHRPGLGVGGESSWRGRGRGRNGRGGPGEWGRGGGRGGIRGQTGSFELGYNGAKEPSYQTDSLTNTSVVLQVCLQYFFSLTLTESLRSRYLVFPQRIHFHVEKSKDQLACHDTPRFFLMAVITSVV